MLHILILISIIVGLLLIIYSVFLLKREDSGQSQGYNYDAENIIKAIDKSVSEVDNAMEEFSKLSEGVFDELSQKYQELLYLYSLVDEKHEKITQSTIDLTTEKAQPAPSYEESKVVYIQPPEPVYDQDTAEDSDTLGDDNASYYEDSEPLSDYSDNVAVGARYEEIFQLHSDGLDSSEIARMLGIGKGEVKLILELGKARG